jgi:hypothetical protein
MILSSARHFSHEVAVPWNEGVVNDSSGGNLNQSVSLYQTRNFINNNPENAYYVFQE